jgi:IclR family mhp operon transcriptional activator
MSLVKPIRALDRGLQIIELIAARSSASLHELHLATGLPKATLLRILRTLADRKWVQLRANSPSYVAGPLLLPGARAPRQHNALGTVAIPVLDALSQKVVWPSDLGIRRGDTMWIIEHSRRNARFVINRNAVGRRPRFLQSALGRAYLAHCPQDERQDILRLLRQSTHPDDRRAQATRWVTTMLKQTRDQGYGEREPGYWAGADDFANDVSSIAVPLMHGERVIACLNLLWVSDAMTTEEFARRHLATLRYAADDLAHRVAAHHEAKAMATR